MTHPTHRPSRQRDPADTDLLIKGIVVALIGLAVLVAPAFMAAGPLRATVVESYLVGWFALLLGAAFIAQALMRRWSVSTGTVERGRLRPFRPAGAPSSSFRSGSP